MLHEMTEPSAEGGAARPVVCRGEELDRAVMERCQRILQLSFHKDPDRRGYYIPLPEDELLHGDALEAKIDEQF